MSTFFLLACHVFQKSNQFEKRFCIETARWETERVANRRISPVCPLTRDGETAVRGLAQNQRVDTGYASLLEHFKALPSKRMKWMTDFRPSQIRTVGQCSLH